MEFFDTIRQVKSNWNPYKKWDIEQQKKEKQNEELHKKYPPTPKEMRHAKQYGRTIVDVINTMDQHSIDKSEDAGVVAGNSLLPLILGATALGFGLGKGLKRSKLGARLPDLAPYWELIGVIVTESIAMTAGNVWLSKITKQASRVARFQTRENELSDSRNFVVYNEQQIKEAQELAKSMPEVEEHRQDKFSKSTFNPIKTFKNAKITSDNLNKDDAKYQEWKKLYLKEEEIKQEKFKTLNPSKEALIKAEKDRDAMLNTIKKIETTSLNYFNNMEMATFVLSAAVSSVGTVVGVGISGLITSLQKHKKLPDSKYVTALKGGLVIILPVVASMVALAPTNKLVKDAARIGRFKAKQELLNNPHSFITYDDEQRKTVGDLSLSTSNTKPVGLWARFKQDMGDLNQLKADYKEYQNYMNTKHKEDLKLQEALKRVKISDEQRLEATQLQKKAFHSFEIMDEKAQRFTDDTDAAVDTTAQTLASVLALATKLIPVYVCGKEVKAINGGKMPGKFGEVLKLVFSGKLKGTTLALMLMPFVLPQFLKIPIVVKGVQIKKDAGKIGVMTAMKDLDDPKNFLDDKQNSKGV